MTAPEPRRLAIVAGDLALSVDGDEWRRAIVDGRPVDRIDVALAAADRLLPGPPLDAAGSALRRPKMPRLGGQIYGIGLNYRDHARQQGYDVPDEPAVFLKSSTSLVESGDAIELPTDEAGRYEVETELAIVVGRTARDLDTDGARDAVAGMAVANDVSDRLLQHHGQIALAKGRDTFCPLGPWITLVGADDPCTDRTIRTWIDDVLVQECSTAEMIHSAVDLVRFLSRHTTLHPGDVILTGTPGGTVAGLERGLAIRPGSSVVSEIDGIGRVVNRVRLKEDG